MNRIIKQEFQVQYRYPVYFTSQVFDPENRTLASLLEEFDNGCKRKILFIIDDKVAKEHDSLSEKIENYLRNCSVENVEKPVIISGGEQIKNEPEQIAQLHKKFEKNKMCRHSFIAAIGGGALLDMVGFACATPHRGLRLLRFPTTVLSQNDSGIGVKNAVNYFDKKNFFGIFAPPFAVINDSHFLITLNQRDWNAGIAEAVKVALLKDRNFFQYIDSNAKVLLNRNMAVMEQVIYQCAFLHLSHIKNSGDAFEQGHSRPLDFGHWAAHKLETLSQYRIRHGEAVAAGIALDVRYSCLCGLLSEKTGNMIINTLQKLNFPLYYKEMETASVFNGLDEFREHLGGKLTITLLSDIATPIDVHHMDKILIRQAIDYLRDID